MAAIGLNFNETLATPKGLVTRMFNVGFAPEGKPNEFEALLSLPPVHGEPSYGDYRSWKPDPAKFATELEGIRQTLNGVTSLAVNTGTKGDATVAWRSGNAEPFTKSPLASAPDAIKTLVDAARAVERRLF